MTLDLLVKPDEGTSSLIHDVKIGKLKGSYILTIKTLQLFKNIINNYKWVNAAELLKIIRAQGIILESTLPHEVSIATMTRRFLKLIREEFVSLQISQYSDDAQASLSLHKLVTQNSECENNLDFNAPQIGLKEALIDHIQEIETELETTSDNITAQAKEHVHSSEVILTIGQSQSVENFLKRAIKERQNLTIIIAECAPACKGHDLAANIAAPNIDIVVIPDSAIFAMMSRVNKVIIGTHSVVANGGLRAACGTYAVALAAKHYSVPVIVLTPMYKLLPIHVCSYEQASFNLVGCAEDILSYNSLATRTSKIYNPIFDYVPPELVTLFISNIGGHAPSYVYRLLTELYHPEDYVL